MFHEKHGVSINRLMKYNSVSFLFQFKSVCKFLYYSFFVSNTPDGRRVGKSMMLVKLVLVKAKKFEAIDDFLRIQKFPQ